MHSAVWQWRICRSPPDISEKSHGQYLPQSRQSESHWCFCPYMGGKTGLYLIDMNYPPNMGRITKTTSNDVTITYAFDEMGRKYTESEYTADGNYSVFRGYFYEGVSKYLNEEITGLYHTLMYGLKDQYLMVLDDKFRKRVPPLQRVILELLHLEE